MTNEPQYLDEPVQLIKEIPENMVVSRFLRRKTYPGSEYYRLTVKGTMPRVYKALGSKLRKATTTITEDTITITGGGFGGKQTYHKGGYNFKKLLVVFDKMEEGTFIGWK